MEKNVCIVHFNTPELTKAAVLSVWKNTPDCKITIFDNSTQRPFEPMDGVRIIDNTKKQVFDFDEYVKAFPNRVDEIHGHASANHMYSIQTLWDYFPEGFLLMDSDILIKKDISNFFDNRYPACGTAAVQVNCRCSRTRLVPFLCYINVSMCREYGIKYFDPEKCWTLTPVSVNGIDSWWDTGASFLDELNRAGLAFKFINIWKYICHFGAGSHGGFGRSAKKWLEIHKKLYL